MIKRLKTRMILIIAGSGILLALCYWVVLFSFLLLPEDVIFSQQLNFELQRQETYYTQHGTFDQLPTGMNLYIGNQINSHPDAETIIQLPSGTDDIEYLNLYIAKSTFRSEPLYIIYDVDHQNIELAGINQFNQMLLHSLNSAVFRFSTPRITDR